MCATYRDKERRSNFESFANKILTGIKEIEPEYAEKRAIWELFQNALDTIDQDGEISIEKTKRGFRFTHNGKPFKDDHIGGLIKQYSNGKFYGENSVFVGQYGTGFLSTHVYGKKVEINSAILTDSNELKLLDKFDLDRSADSIDLLTDALLIQDNKIAKLCDEDGNICENYVGTEFEYIANDHNRISIDVMFDYVHTVLPFIFCFNLKLNKVVINNGVKKTIYSDPVRLDYTFTLQTNEAPYELSFDYISSDSDGVKIIIPKNQLPEIPKVFLFYPLIDTSDIGFNFIIHGQEFKPNRERDYLHLESSNEDVKKDVETNKKLLTDAFSLIIERAKEDEAINFYSLVNIEFKQSEEPFMKQIKRSVINELKSLPRIDGLSICDLVFFDREILSLGDDVLRAYYQVYSQYYKIIPYEEFIFLSQLSTNWTDEGIEDVKNIGIEEYFKLIVEGCECNFDKIKYKQEYIKVVNSVSGNINLLNEIGILPNIHNKLKRHADLLRWESYEPLLLGIMDAINADVSTCYLHLDFYFLKSIRGYTRVSFKEDFSKFCNHLNDKLSKDEIVLTKESVTFQCLVETLNHFIGLNQVTELNRELHTFFCKKMSLSLCSDILSSPTTDTNFQPAFKLLSRLYLISVGKDLSNSVKNTIYIEDLLNLVRLLNSNINLKDELLDKLECFPNQNFQLKSQAQLKIDHIRDDIFKIQSFRILEKNIKDDLVDERFNDYLQHTNKLTGEEIGAEIEIKLNSNRVFFPVEKDNADKVNDEKLKVVLELIQFISEYPATWGNWLPNINKVKEEILMFKFQDEKTRKSLFSILSESEDKILLLGELATVPDLQNLINAGKEKQKEEARKKQHLEYISKVGLEIQNLIEGQLANELSSTYSLAHSIKDSNLKTIEEQNGQDFIIYKDGLPFYYIEVKSRWDMHGVVALSKRQVEKCAQKPDKYAVITVNVADYKSYNSYIDDEVSFDALYDHVYVNTDLSAEFRELIKENIINEGNGISTKLIEFRGHIPQDRIKGENSTGIKFNEFIQELKSILIT
ncbi:sacsin N-terminal ATP-binding-like domain-containing protein [Sphingobacterium multivorum]|uniref:sacsin N-terminal ATP-binding-like domain-containing protein n=1 Tax=Sphingobacterium multivorum TaxID=28454 RepID=UPI003DA56E51